MSKESHSGAIDAVSAPPGSEAANAQIELQIDDAAATAYYSTLARVWGSAEEFYMDFCAGMRQVGPQKALMKVDQRIVLSPWAAKRLSLALAQAVANYEQVYGQLEPDPAQRQAGSKSSGGSSGSTGSGGPGR